MIAMITSHQASRDDWASALIGYIECDGREGAERVNAQLDSAGNLIDWVSRDARNDALDTA